MTSSVQPCRTSPLCFSFLFLLIVLNSSSSAQITIPQTGFSNLLTVGASLYFYKSDLAPRPLNIGKRGGPAVYDFNNYSFERNQILNVYSAGSITVLAARYPGKAIVIGNSSTTIQNSPVFLFGTDTLFVLGQASLPPQQRFLHIRPYEPMTVFPVTFQAARTYTHTHYDTLFNASGSVASTNFYIGSDSMSVDGFGTLKVLGRQFECLRVRSNHFTFSDKEFMFLTREGVFLDVAMASSQRDTGLVQPTDVMLLVPSSVVSAGQEALLPVNCTLDQNYPNPFNPSTTIQYSIPTASFTSLKVFNVLGAEIATLVNEFKVPGTYQVTWNANGYPSGVYLYRLISAGRISTGRMTLLK